MERNLSMVFFSESFLPEILTPFLPTMISEIYLMYFYVKSKFVMYCKDRRVFLLKSKFEKADDPAIYMNVFLNEDTYFMISINFI